MPTVIFNGFCSVSYESRVKNGNYREIVVKRKVWMHKGGFICDRVKLHIDKKSFTAEQVPKKMEATLEKFTPSYMMVEK